MNDSSSSPFTPTASDSLTFTFTNGTSDYSSTISFDDTLFPCYVTSNWIPYLEKKYIPKWHITQGYKNQIKTMWND